MLSKAVGRQCHTVYSQPGMKAHTACHTGKCSAEALDQSLELFDFQTLSQEHSQRSKANSVITAINHTAFNQHWNAEGRSVVNKHMVQLAFVPSWPCA
jgi:hypothetical protein